MSTNPRSLGKYQLHERLGRGGMAEVWKAFDPQLKRYVAIKFLQANLRADPTFAARFTREAQAVASLRHPNIIRIYDFDTSMPGSNESVAYMVMDYIEGETLADYIRSTSYTGKFPAASEIVHLFTPIGAAIDYAHQHGMIHRDIKPANILLDRHNTAQNPMGEPILSDFGIVKMLGTDAGTLTSSSVGTPLYISPEQAKGQPGSEASDIYALGVTLYEVCTGRPPFSGESPYAIIHQHISAPPPPPSLINPALPPALEAVILRCLAKEPAERFPSAAALTSALAGALHGAATQGQAIYSSNIINQPTSYKPLQSDATQLAASSPPAQVQSVKNIAASPAETEPTLLPAMKGSNAPPSATQSPSTLHTPIPPTLAPKPRRGLYVALIALLVIVLGGSALGAFFLLSARSQPQGATPGIVGHGFFSSSGQSSGPNSQGINDTFQIHLSNIPDPSAGKSYYAWLLPDYNQSEASSLSLGPVSITQGIASLSTTYVDPQHTNLVGRFSRLLITEEATNPPPQSYALDKTAWRYYAEIPQSPASTNCASTLNQLSNLCHVRHLLSDDPELRRVGLPSGLNYWFVNNNEEIQKWAREAVDHHNAADVRHKIVDILYMLDGLHCIEQDLHQAAPGTDNTPDDNSLNKIAAIPLLNCSLTPLQPGYLIHIHNHLNAIAQSPGVLSDQATLAGQISTELNTINALLTRMHGDAQQLIAMDDAHLTQAKGLALRSEMDALATRILSGGNDPNTGEAQPGVARISDQMQQLATFDVMVYTKP